MAEPWVTSMFKNLVRKEAAVKEKKICRGFFWAPTRHCFPEQMSTVSRTGLPWKDVHVF